VEQRRLNGLAKIAPAVLVALGLVALTGCVSRPTPDVLKPVHLQARADEAVSNRVSVLAATNRTPDTMRGGFGSAWADNLTYEQYAFSVPPDRKGTTIAYPTSTLDPERQFAVIGRKQLAKDAFVEEALRSVQPDGTIGIFVHGYNYSYQEALYRTAQIAADAKMPGAPILFSWPSAAAVAGYVADRDAALASRSALDSLVTSLSASGKVKRIVLFGHSMGGFLVMETVRQLTLQHRDDVVDKLAVILAAPDIDVDVFRSQLADIGRMPIPISLLVSKDDRALVASSFIAGERPRVGRLDINDPVIEEAAVKERLRVIDITSIQASDGLGHDRYASLAKFGAQLASFESGKRTSAGDVGAYVFDAAGAAVASPFRLAGRVVGAH